MPEPDDRLNELRARWEADPSSRIFVQLAEEYRRHGQPREALEVLQAGLQKVPSYLSAQVALARCQIELGEVAAACTVLEGVVRRDTTHLVANKLLVQAYLDNGQPRQAWERLEHYSLLNDTDADLPALRQRIKQAQRRATAGEDTDAAISEPPAEPILATPAVPPPPVAPPLPVEDAFVAEPVPEAPPASPELAAGELFEEPFADLLSGPPIASTSWSEDEDLFPELSSSASEQSRYLEALAAEGLFGLEPEPVSAVSLEPEPLVVAEPVAPESEAWLDAAVQPEPEVAEAVTTVQPEPAALETWSAPVPVPPAVPEPAAGHPMALGLFEAPPELDGTDEVAVEIPAAEMAAAEVEVAEVEAAEMEAEEMEAEEMPPPAPPVRPAITATLGQLYLQQGHHEEAERIFREVLKRQPMHPVALAGLQAVERERHKGLRAAALLAGVPVDASLAEKKVFMLQRYLQLLRGQV